LKGTSEPAAYQQAHLSALRFDRSLWRPSPSLDQLASGQPYSSQLVEVAQAVSLDKNAMTTYLVTMAMLLMNQKQDQITQLRIDMARIEAGTNQLLQHQLDIRQTALDTAKKRNSDRIAEIARLN
jgi:hypothetical protein